MGNIKDFIQNDSTQRTITGQRFLEYDKQPWDTNDLLIRIFGLPPVNGFSPSLYDVIVANGGGGGGGTGLATIAKQDDQIGRLDTIISRVNYIEGYIGDPTVLGYTHGSIEALHNIDGWLANVSNNSDTITANVATAAKQDAQTTLLGYINTNCNAIINNTSLLLQRNKLANLQTVKITGTTLSDLVTQENAFFNANGTKSLVSKNTFIDALQYSTILTYSNIAI